MLAPRRKLWSTPREALLRALQVMRPEAGDVVYDVGCGEGQFLVECALGTEASRIVGIEIDEERALVARAALDERGLEADRCEVVVANALEHDFSDGTCFFLYLIPRGLKLILPLLRAIKHPIRVASYMSPLPGVAHCSVAKVSTSSHPDALWPIYFYELQPADADPSP